MCNCVKMQMWEDCIDKSIQKSHKKLHKLCVKCLSNDCERLCNLCQ